jgi:hypothetical protein
MIMVAVLGPAAAVSPLELLPLEPFAASDDEELELWVSLCAAVLPVLPQAVASMAVTASATPAASVM